MPSSRAYADAVKHQPDRLPWVNTGYLVAMLNRLGTLPGMAEDVHAIRESVTGEEAKEQALQAYLDWVRRRCGYLPLRGVDVGASDPTAQQRSMELAQVYVELDTKTQVTQVEEVVKRLLRALPEDTQTDSSGEEVTKRLLHAELGERKTRPLRALEAAIANPRLVLLGDPRPGVGLDPETGLPDILWCEVPAGAFLMGSDKEQDSQAYDDELPQHEVPLSAYSIGKYPVTNAQYAAFVEADGYRERRYWTEAGWRWKEDRTGPDTYGGVFDLPNHPVVVVSWYEAIAFCHWLTERLRENGQLGTDQEVTLPTEAQWEKAARGADGRIYPWGDEPNPEKANYADTGIGTTSAVGCFPAGATPYDTLDMSGNVWEWCQTRWVENYKDYHKRAKDREQLEGTTPRVIRGGAFFYGQGFVRCASRFRYNPDYRYDYLGFRVGVAPVRL